MTDVTVARTARSAVAVRWVADREAAAGSGVRGAGRTRCPPC
ncbi:hypothetical protein [Spongiactinospora sp. TRM90649]|nr:hypothetical protein [Spongiactinospora sp. TRM90649]MDF5757837.1 hypothetical protein [Spongiactinospora sp. TRM90649]